MAVVSMMREPTHRSRPPRRWAGVVCGLLLAALAAWPPGPAKAAYGAATLEDPVKAAFLYKFASFVEWPPQAFPAPDTPITIGVLGAERIAAELARMVAGRAAQGRSISVRRLAADESVAGLHILFVGRAEAGRLQRLAQAARPHAVLLVTDSEGALGRGSMINFVLADRRLRFEIALDAAERSGLRLSSRLLSVALHVRREAP